MASFIYWNIVYLRLYFTHMLLASCPDSGQIVGEHNGILSLNVNSLSFSFGQGHQRLFGYNKASNIFPVFIVFPPPISSIFHSPPMPAAIRMTLDSACVSKEHLGNPRLLSCGEIDKILKIKTENDVSLKNSSLLNVSFQCLSNTQTYICIHTLLLVRELARIS